MNIVFLGTPDFAVPTLESLYNAGHNIQLVVTQPDKPSGRGKKLKKSAVKEKAEELGLEVYQPIKIKDEESIAKIKALEPDFIVVVAYGQILRKNFLDIPKYGCINVHASLLPQLRGSAPINWAVINGMKKSGVTTMIMDVGIDTGDMLLTDEAEITDDMTAGELHDVLKYKGANLLIKTLDGLISNTITPIKQDNDKSSYISMLTKEFARINWNECAQNVHNKIRGLNPDQIAYFVYNGLNYKVYKTIVTDIKSQHEPGYVEKVDNKKGIYIATQDYDILIKEIQIPGKNKMRVEDFLRGNTFEESIIL